MILKDRSITLKECMSLLDISSSTAQRYRTEYKVGKFIGKRKDGSNNLVVVPEDELLDSNLSNRDLADRHSVKLGTIWYKRNELKKKGLL